VVATSGRPFRRRRDVIGALAGPVFWLLVCLLVASVSGLCGDVVATIADLTRHR